MKKIFQKIETLSRKNNILYWVRGIIFITLVICTIVFLIDVFHKKKVSVVSTTLQPTENYRDKYDNLRSEIKVQEVESKKQFKQLTDSFKQLLKGRPSIKEVTQYVSIIDTEFVNLPVTMKGDSIFSVIKQDEYIMVSAQGNINTGIGEINLVSIDSITYINYEKKKFLKSNEHTINLSNKNPYNTIISGNSIQYREPKAILVFGPTFVYNPFNNRFSGGIGISYNLFSIKTRR